MNTTDATTPRSPEGLIAAREVDLRRALRVGIVIGIVVVFVGAIGMLVSMRGRVLIAPWFTATYALMGLLGVAAGYMAGRPPEQLEGYEAAKPGPRNVLAGLIAGVPAGLVPGLFVAVVAPLDVRRIFVNVTDGLVELMTFGRGVGWGVGLLLAGGVVLGMIGGALHLIPLRIRRPFFTAVGWVLGLGLVQVLASQVFRGMRLGVIADWLYRGSAGGLEPLGALAIFAVVFIVRLLTPGRARQAASAYRGLPTGQRRVATLVGLIVILMILGALPHVLGGFLSSTFVFAGTYLLMALGLNIVIGFAGLLDLGYVAFFAVGAYMTAVLTSSQAPGVSPEMTFWLAIPFIILAASLAGLLVGTPVLRMRGDYLAIVTLGFGQIAHLIALSDWQRPRLGGAQGIGGIPPIKLGPIDIGDTRVFPEIVQFIDAQQFFYLIFGFALLFTYITYSLQRSRVGRAWNAMREDEPVAEAMGVNIVTAKLLAFVTGAIMASLGGALFAHRIGSVFPQSFTIIVSITVVAIVIVGGMGSVPGVVVAAFVLVGLPEILREFQEFKFLLYGVLLVYMMIKRPGGFIPSRRRQRELEDEERQQDVWLRKGSTESGGGGTMTSPQET